MNVILYSVAWFPQLYPSWNGLPSNAVIYIPWNINHHLYNAHEISQSHEILNGCSSACPWMVGWTIHPTLVVNPTTNYHQCHQRWFVQNPPELNVYGYILWMPRNISWDIPKTASLNKLKQTPINSTFWFTINSATGAFSIGVFNIHLKRALEIKVINSWVCFFFSRIFQHLRKTGDDITLAHSSQREFSKSHLQNWE